MRRLTALSAAACLTLGAARAPAPVDYRLSPVMAAGAVTALAVEVRLTADANGRTKLELPDQRGSATELWRNLRDLRVEGARRVIEDRPAARTLVSAPGAPLTIRYRVVSAVDHDPVQADRAMYKPLFRPGWFRAEGEALFVIPEGRTRATFRWVGPAGLPFASDLQHFGGKAGSIDDIAESTLIGGRDVRIARRQVAGAPVQIAIVGRYRFDEATFIATTERALAAERRFWGGREGPFVVSLAPFAHEPGLSSFSGTGRGDAFTMMATDNVDADALTRLLAHEYFHTWNPARLGGLPDDEAQRARYWFSEGFTDFYARRLMLRAGLMSPQAFADAWNEVLRAYGRSTVRAAPNSRIVADFWSNEEVGQLPYQRGAMLAALWDAQLVRKGASLDAVLRDQRDAARTAAKGVDAAQLFVRTARRHGLDVSTDLARHVEAGEPVILPADAFGPCFRVEIRHIPSFDRGWDSDATRKAGLVITGLRDGTPAYAAGLRNGMKVVEVISGHSGDAAVPYVLRVRDPAGSERTITFLPAGPGGFETQQLALTGSGAACGG